MPDFEGVRIDELNPTLAPSLEHVVAAMKDGDTVQLSIAQIKELIDAGLLEVTAEQFPDIPNKAVPVAADGFTFFDSVTSALRRLTWTNLVDAIRSTATLAFTGQLQNLRTSDDSALVDIGSTNAGADATRVHGIAIVDKNQVRIGGFSMAKNGGDGNPRMYLHVGGFGGGDLAVQIDTGGNVTLTKQPLAVGHGGTGARTATDALTNLGVSSFIKGLLDDTSASAAQTTLGISNFVKTLLDDADASTFLSTLGVSAFVKTLLDDADGNTFWTTLGANWNNASTGYFKLPNGFILQWGIVNQVGAADFTLNWGISFPNAIRTALAMPLFNNTSVSELSTVNLSNLGVSNCSCRPRYVAAGGTVDVTSGMPIAWIAIGS